MERFTYFEKIFNKDRLKGSLDAFFLHVAGINDAENRRKIVESIMQEADKREYFNEEEFIEIVENVLNQHNLQDKLDEILPKSDNQRKLHKLLQRNFENYYRTSPEKKGVNFRDRLDTPESVRAYLYLTLPEDQRSVFQSDFEKLLTQKEEFYLRFWPPKIALRLRDLFRGKISGDFQPGEFFKEVRSYIEDLQQGKNKITLYFSEDLLPKELQDKSEADLNKLGVFRKENEYEIYLTPDKIQDILFTLVEKSLSVAEKETEIGKKLSNIKELFKEAKKNLRSLPEGQAIIASYASLIAGLESRYREAFREGMSEEEAKKLLETADKLEKALKEIVEGSKDDKKRGDVLLKAKDWLKTNGSIIASSFALWGLAVGWFLPLYLITKMYDQIEKSGFVGK